MAAARETTPQPVARTFALEGLTLQQMEVLHSLLGQVAPVDLLPIGKQNDAAGSLSGYKWIGELFKDIGNLIERGHAVKHRLKIDREGGR